MIPVYNSSEQLDCCLQGLRASSQQPLECIVVDDGSTDDSVAVAQRYGAKVISTTGRHGPARARNLGAQAAQGDILLFLDADVCVHPDTLAKVVLEFSQDPGLTAVMGSYDTQPSAPGYLSQFRNLMHHFVHQKSKREATTFFAGCGAIRKRAFLDFGGFDESYRTPSIEDIELGYRMTKAGRKLVLNPDIQVTHLKRWGLRLMLKTDFFYRALPWSELSLRRHMMPNDLNLHISQRISVLLVAILTALAAYLVVAHTLFLPCLLVTLLVLLSEYLTESLADRSTGPIIGMVVALAVITALSLRFRTYGIVPAVLTAWVAVFVRHRYAYSREVWRRWTGLLVGGYLLSVIGFVWYFLPWHPLECVFMLLLLTVLALNKQFYIFLAADRGKLFACAAIPFHLLYFGSSGLAFFFASIRHASGQLLSAPPAPAPIETPRVRAAVP